MAKKFKFSVHPSLSMVQNALAGLQAKTGRSMDEWIAYGKKNGPKDVPARRDWLMKEGLTTNYSWWISDRIDGKGEEDTPDGYLKAAEVWVEKMFSGNKAGLRPLFDALLEAGLSMGDDVKVCPCQTIVPLFREHVFAQVKPSTQTRIDFGLHLPGEKAGGRLIDTGGEKKKDRITHKIEVTSLDDVDSFLKKWLKKAYEKAEPKKKAK